MICVSRKQLVYPETGIGDKRFILCRHQTAIDSTQYTVEIFDA